MGWSNKYKKSINCNNPKGFSQKAHCAGKKKRNENIMKISEFKEMVKNVLRERSIKAISKAQEKNLADIERVLELYKKAKGGNKSYNEKNLIKALKKLGQDKKKLEKELDDKVSGMYKNAEYKGESVEESINEGPSTEEKRIAMLAVRKQAKYRNVSLEQAIQDQINALEELKRDAKRGKLR